MDQEMKRMLRNNVIKFIIGSILLGFCTGYLINHPAEKGAIFSGFEVLLQRVEIFVSGFVKKEDGDLLKSKFDYEKTYDELLLLAQKNPCVEEITVQEIRETIKALQSESMQNLATTLPGYIRKTNEYGRKVMTKCDKK